MGLRRRTFRQDVRYLHPGRAGPRAVGGRHRAGLQPGRAGRGRTGVRASVGTGAIQPGRAFHGRAHRGARRPDPARRPAQAGPGRPAGVRSRPPAVPGQAALVCGFHGAGPPRHGRGRHARVLPNLDRSTAPATRRMAAYLRRTRHRPELRGVSDRRHPCRPAPAERTRPAGDCGKGRCGAGRGRSGNRAVGAGYAASPGARGRPHDPVGQRGRLLRGLRRFPGRAAGAGLSRRGRMIFDSGGVTDQQAVRAFATGLPETRTFPTDIWERLQRQALKEHRGQVLLHGAPQGAAPLRKAIASYLNLERGANVSADQILVLSSTRQALFLCAHLLVDAGKPILLENPGYFGAKKAFESAEARIVPIDVDEQGIRTDLLRADRSGANCVYVTPSHQYPTGATLSLARRLELTRWAAENGKWIIEDDYDSEFHYEGLPTACVQGLDKYQRTLYIGTFSKTLYPGLRMGYIALPTESCS
ncbi:hypothetical protein G6F31_012215 [Rhizopus arrhizus]|nr:hypothetical protein G6F31_012215 [Rhizopus arrhizus]